MTATDLATQGVGTPGEWMATLPAAGRVPITEGQASGADARGDIATVSLRGLGSGNTLILLNGRRMAPHPISMPEGVSGVPSMATNVNALPSAAIDRVEVLRTGASALYGSDATAGVINTILRRDADGGAIGFRWLATQHGGASEYRASLTGGAGGGQEKTSVIFSYDYFHRDELRNRQREFSRHADFRALAPAPWDGTTDDTSADRRSDRGFFGRFQRGTVNADGTVTGSRPAGVSAGQVSGNGTFYFAPVAPGSATRTMQSSAPDQSSASPARDYYLNVNQYRFLLPATRRHTLHLGFDRKLSGNILFFGEADFYRADSRNQREPSRIDAVADGNVTIPADNPYNPFGSRFYSSTGAPNPDGTPRLTGTPSPVVLTRVSLPEFGARRIDVRSENARAVAGLRGTFGAGWHWESALLHGTARTTDLESNAIKESELRDALARTDPATALNPFMTTFAVVNGALTVTGTPFTNPESVVAPLQGTFFRQGRTSLSSWDFRVNGPLVEGPAGTVRLAAGGEHRREGYVDFRDAESGRLGPDDVQRLGLRPELVDDNNFLQVSPSDNTDAHRHTDAAFAELAAPLFRGEEGAALRSLGFSAAVRIERTSSFGQATTPQAGLTARVTSGLTLRASVSDSFREPNLAALFSGAVQRSITGVNDAYRAAVTHSSDDGPSARRVSLRSGNAGLRPEKARTTTVGLVFEPPAWKGFKFAIDAWKIAQTDAMTRLDAPDIIAEDTALLAAANAAAQGNPVEQVDLSAAGSSHVLRHPVTAQDRDAFAAYNAGRPRSEQRAPVGAIRAIAESYLNATRRDLAGVDFLFSYRSTDTPLGTFQAGLEAAYLPRFDEQLNASAPRTDLSSRDGNTPWKGSLTLHWSKGPWAAGVFTTYVGRTQDSFLRTTATGAGVSDDGFLMVGSSWLTNVSLTRHFDGRGVLQHASIRLGVNNLFDAEPPFGLGASSDTDGYLRGFGDPRGRAFSLELTKRF